MKHNIHVHFSNKSDEWETPTDLFLKLSEEFGPFHCDVAATNKNRKVAKFFSLENDALLNDWEAKNWCNPPYSLVKAFCRKAMQEQKKGNLTVMLIPARTDTVFFHDYIYNKPNVEIRFLRGRLRFITPDGSLLRKGASNSAPFPSMVVIFRPCERKENELT